jgi:hypothetical protein
MPSLLATPSSHSLGEQVARQRLVKNLTSEEAAGSPSARIADALQAQTFYRPMGDNDIYGLLSEVALKESLRALNGFHQSTSVVHLAPSDLTH